MKPFIIITGPQAVGKMAVGMALRDLYNYRLFHNHMSIELIIDIFGSLNASNRRVVKSLRESVFNEVFDQELEGFVFTFTWAFCRQDDHDYIQSLIQKFESRFWSVFIVELEASLETRLKRNRTPLRLENKASKKNLEWSDQDVIRCTEVYRLNSELGEITHPYYLRLNNESLEPDKIAIQIYNYVQSKVEICS